MIDPNEAPEGFVAKPGDTCDGCWFFANNEKGCPDVECHQSGRKDGEDVIFVPREKSNLAEFSAIGELAEARAEIDNLTVKLADLIKENAELEKRVENQKGRIRYLEGATSHATGTPLSKAKDEAARWKAACLERDELIAKLKAQLTTALEAIARMR